MADFIKQLSKSILVLLVGVALFVLGAADQLSIGDNSITVGAGWRVVVAIFGGGLACFGAYLVLRESDPGKTAKAPSGETQSTTADRSSGIRVFDEANTGFLYLKNQIIRDELKVQRAELIQHSSERAFTLVKALAGKDVDIQLYLQHPGTLDILCGDLKPRVNNRLSLYPHDLEGEDYKGRLRIYLYRTPASFNGVRLVRPDGGALIALSWYTYKSYAPLGNLVNSKFGGSENPCILIHSTHPEYPHFADFFDDLVDSCEKQGTPPVLEMDKGRYEWLQGWPVA